MAARLSSKRLPRYSLQFKLGAVRLTKMPGIGVQVIARALDIHPSCCRAGVRRREKAGYAVRRRHRLGESRHRRERLSGCRRSSGSTRCSRRSTSS
jgi:transposase-like protein